MHALREQADLGQVGKGKVAILIQKGRQVREVQGEGEEGATLPGVQPLFAGGQQ